MINRATILGRIGKKDSKETKDGQQMTKLSIATNRKHKDATGESKEQTTWHMVVLFNKLADISAKYAHVGDLVYIEGDINHRKIEDGEYAGRMVYSITAHAMKVIPTGRKNIEEYPNEKVDRDVDIPF